MATAKVPETESSDEVFDYNCTMCQKKRKKFKKAVKFCRECNKYFCTSCLDQHNDYMDNHTLQDPADSSSQNVVLPVDHCETHKGSVLELFCEEHDDVICNTCLAFEHRHCTTVKYIPSEAQYLLEDKKFKEVKTGLTHAVENLAEYQITILKQKEKLFTERSQHLSSIKEQQRKLIDIIKTMGDAAKDEVKILYKELDESLTEMSNKCNNIKSNIDECLKKLEIYADNKPQTFVTIKKGQKFLSTTEKLTNQFLDATGKQDMKYLPHPDIETCLTGFQSLGCIQTQQPHPYQVTQKRDISVKLRSDHNTCRIVDVCILTDGSILVTDGNNKRLKRLSSSTFNVTDHCKLPGHPFCACCTCPHEVAVCLELNIVQFVSVRKKMTLTKQINLSHHCVGIAYSNNELFVCSGTQKTVYVYSMSGQLLRKIGQTQTGQNMFFSCIGLVVGDQGGRIYITDVDSGMICVDRQGRELYRYRGTKLKSASGICCDDKTNILVLGLHSNNVVQLGNDGEELCEVLTQSDGLSKPFAACFDRNQKRLIVTNSETDTILVCDIV